MVCCSDKWHYFTSLHLSPAILVQFQNSFFNCDAFWRRSFSKCQYKWVAQMWWTKKELALQKDFHIYIQIQLHIFTWVSILQLVHHTKPHWLSTELHVGTEVCLHGASCRGLEYQNIQTNFCFSSFNCMLEGVKVPSSSLWYLNTLPASKQY